MSPRSLLSATLALGAVLALGACDTTEYYEVEDTSLRVFVADFSFDPEDYDPPRANDVDQVTASFDARDARVTRGSLDDALATVGDGALVMLYIDLELVSAFDGAEGNTTWSALPLSRSIQEVVLNDDDGVGETISVVGYTVSYEYSFDNQDLYFDVVSSIPYDEFSEDPRVLFDFLVPQRTDGTGDIDLRLVVIPDDLYYSNAGAGARVDLRDYQAVKKAFDLPD